MNVKNKIDKNYSVKIRDNWFAIVVTLLFIVFPLVIKSDYIIDVAFFFGIYTLLGLSLNIVLGEVCRYRCLYHCHFKYQLRYTCLSFITS